MFQEETFSRHIVVVYKSGDESVAKLLSAVAQLSPNPELIKTSYLKSNDTGPAQAVNRGMNLLQSQMMTWLGSDDMLFPGSLSTIESFLKIFPDCEWVTGRSLIINAAGVLVPPAVDTEVVRSATGFPQEAVSLALHASIRNLPFIQQEGTFWANSLWEKSGGALDENLRLAFDLELWTRMADFGNLTQLNVPLGIFRQRAGQLSSDRGEYFREVQAVRGKIKSRRKGLRFPFSASGPVAISDSSGNWSIRPVLFRFYSRESASSPRGFFILQQKVLRVLKRRIRTSLLVQSASAAVRKRSFLNLSKNALTGVDQASVVEARANPPILESNRTFGRCLAEASSSNYHVCDMPAAFGSQGT